MMKKSHSVDGYFSQWSPWSSCNQTCGGGWQSRGRHCVMPLYGGESCLGPVGDYQPCNTEPCPVDCSWTEWSRWTMCPVTCGGGVIHRMRHKLGPFHGGQDCEGGANDTQLCGMELCPVDGHWSAWNSWTLCPVSCGGGIQSRDRVCIEPKHGGQSCPGFEQQQRECSLDLCPVDGSWQSWEVWSNCDTTCGLGSQKRQRKCNPPISGGKQCEGVAHQFFHCNLGLCPVDGVWNPWSEWTQCTVTCGGGVIRRTRICQGPYNGGEHCQGQREETESCGTITCLIPRPWLDWSPWSPCTTTCDGGTRTRSRSCNTGELGPDYHRYCTGSDYEIQECHQYPCFPVARSCQDWYNRGMRDNCSAEIDPGGRHDPFWVRCVISLATGTGLTNVAAIKNPYDNTTAMTYWLNKDYAPCFYWGGADPSSDMCSCGMSNLCAQPHTKCNCDANDAVWRSDEGYITLHDDLPITGVHAGDTGGADEKGYFTVGPLQCI